MGERACEAATKTSVIVSAPQSPPTATLRTFMACTRRPLIQSTKPKARYIKSRKEQMSVANSTLPPSSSLIHGTCAHPRSSALSCCCRRRRRLAGALVQRPVALLAVGAAVPHRPAALAKQVLAPGSGERGAPGACSGGASRPSPPLPCRCGACTAADIPEIPGGGVLPRHTGTTTLPP
jgi:hypothetical protein